MAQFIKSSTEYAIPADLADEATALMSELADDGRDVCKLMRLHLYMMLTTATPDAGALAEDVETMASYLGSGGGQ